MVGAEEEGPWRYVNTDDIGQETAIWYAWVVKEVPYKANLTVHMEEHQQKAWRSYFNSGKALLAGAPGRIPGASGGTRKGKHSCLDSKGSWEEKKNIGMLY